MPTWLVVITTVAATYLLSVLVRQFTAREKKITHRIEHRYGAADDQFARTIGSMLPPSIRTGNAVRMLENGREIFPAMLDAIRGAQRTITFESFIYWSGDTGRRFAEALIERANAGVDVRIALDWFGSKSMDQDTLRRLYESPIDVRRYHKPGFTTLAYSNRRTHRKLLVVDGRVGFIGGVGIADEWDGDGRGTPHGHGGWRDSHFRVEGPAVLQLQAAFLDNWLKTSDRVLHDETFFPPEAERFVGEADCQVFQSSPDEGSHSMRLLFLLAITAAQQSVRIASAYFVPDTLSVATLVGARQRGVEVEIIVPGEKIDMRIVRRASRARWGDLLRAGVRIYEYQPTMYHRKVMVIDDVWTTVGSTNFDNRSFRLNDEANLNVYDRDFARAVAESLQADRRDCREVTYEMWKNRSAADKVREALAGLLRSQL